MPRDGLCAPKYLTGSLPSRVRQRAHCAFIVRGDPTGKGCLPATGVGHSALGKATLRGWDIQLSEKPLYSRQDDLVASIKEARGALSEYSRKTQAATYLAGN